MWLFYAKDPFCLWLNSSRNQIHLRCQLNNQEKNVLFIAVSLQVYIIILQGYLILHGWWGKPEHKKKISKSLLVIDTISIKSVNGSWVTIVIYHNKIILPPESGLLHLYYKHAPCMQKAVFLFGFFNTPAWLSLTILLVFLRLYSAHGFLTKNKIKPLVSLRPNEVSLIPV